MTSNKQVVAVRSERIAPCMTCPICHKLYKNATTITECLHTFCRKCIHHMITEEDLDTCPVCNVYLGCSPLDKLRTDHSLQDLRALIFGSLSRKGSKKAEAGPSNPSPSIVVSKELPEAEPSVAVPSRRKERSLSSLVSPPKASNQTGTKGRKKSVPKKVPSSRGSTLSIEEPNKNEEKSAESSSPPLTLTKITQSKKQNAGESSKQNITRLDAKEPIEPLEGMTDLWKPLNTLVEAAGITKSSKPTMQGPVPKSIPSGAQEDEAPVNKTKSKEQANKKIHDDEEGSNPLPTVSVKPKKIHGRWQKRAIASEGPNVAPQPVVNAANTICSTRVHPIWFSLVASDDQEGAAPLPQIPSCYLRIKNPNLPVSSIQKYIVQKLDLDDEVEVEITLQGQPVIPTLTLHNLMDLWLKRASKSERITTTAGSSAMDFIMVLCYGRKV